MRAAEQFCAGAASALALAAIGCGASALDRSEDGTRPARTTVPARVVTQTLPLTARCQEDDPCWDCKRMGNRRCGTPYVHPTGIVEWR